MFKFIFCRTLHSQSAASVTTGNLCALLRAQGHTVEMNLIDIDDADCYAKIISHADEHRVLLYKVNSMDYAALIPLLEKAYQNKVFSRIFVCGPFATLNAERMMDYAPFIDGIILGYGEYTIRELANSLTRNANYEWDLGISGGVWRDYRSRQIVHNQVEKTIPLRELPLPARDIEMADRHAIANLDFSRGCENRCMYCHMRALLEKCQQKRERKSVDQVFEDIKYLYSLNKRYLIFNDSVFWNGEEDTPYIADLCNRIIESKMQVYLMIYLSMYHFPDDDLLKLMYRAGLIRIFIGIESNSKEVLAKIKDSEYPIERFPEIRERLNGMHISYHIGYLVFYPFSNMAQVTSSISYLNSIQKLYRVGIVLEKMRLIPFTPMSGYTDSMAESFGLDRAYDYTFRDPVVEELYEKLHETFEQKLHATYIHMELLCCGMDLACSIFYHKRKQAFPELEKSIRKHRANSTKYNNAVYKYIQKVITNITEGKKSNIFSEFQEHYYECWHDLEVSWTGFMENMRDVADIELGNLIPLGDCRYDDEYKKRYQNQ